jgi:hypothetical protein
MKGPSILSALCFRVQPAPAIPCAARPITSHSFPVSPCAFANAPVFQNSRVTILYKLELQTLFKREFAADPFL